MRPSRDALWLGLLLLVAAILGFGAGWWARQVSEDGLEHRAHAAVGRVREAFRHLTR